MATEEDDELARRQRNAVYDAEDEAEAARSAPKSVTELPEMDFSAPDEPADPPTQQNQPLPTLDTQSAHEPHDFAEEPPDPRQAIAKYVASGEKPDPQAPLRAKLSEIAGRKYQPSAGLTDADIERARADRRAQVGRNDFTQAIQAALLRKPFTPTPPDDVAGGLVARRRGEQADFERSRGLEFDATKALGRGLATGKAPPVLTPYQLEQIKRNAVLDEQRRNDKTAADQRHATERGEDVKFREDQGRRADEAQRRQDRLLEMALRKERDAQTQGLPANMELVDGANPAPEQLKEIGTVDQGADEVHRLANRMRKALRETSRLGRSADPDTISIFRQLQAEMTVAYKNAAKLGQISAGDQALIDAVRPEVTGPIANILRSADSFERQLDGMERSAEDKRAAAMKTVGVRRKGGGAPAEPVAVPEKKPTPPKGIPPDAFFMDGAWWYEESGTLKRHTDG